MPCPFKSSWGRQLLKSKINGQFCCRCAALSSAFLRSKPQHPVLREPLLWHRAAGSHLETHEHVSAFSRTCTQTFCMCRQRLLPAYKPPPRPPRRLQLVVSKSGGVKKQEAMQRRERIQIEAQKLQQQQLPQPPLPFPPPYHRPHSRRETPLLLLTGNRLRSRTAREPPREGKSSSTKGNVSR